MRGIGLTPMALEGLKGEKCDRLGIQCRSGSQYVTESGDRKHGTLCLAQLVQNFCSIKKQALLCQQASVGFTDSVNFSRLFVFICVYSIAERELLTIYFSNMLSNKGSFANP